MVDIDSRDLANPRPAARTGAALLSVTLHADRRAALDTVAALPDDVVATGYQAPDFLSAWLAHSPHDPLFVSLAASGSGPVLLPLEHAGANVLAYPGERHANGNFPVGRARDIAALSEVGEETIAAALRGAGLGAHAVVLERQLRDYRGLANPFVFANSATSPNPALSLSLEGGFDAVLSRHSAKRRRKRFRGQERKLAELGGYRYVPSVAAGDVPATLERFYAMKAKRFEQAGIRDVFADDHVRRFFAELFANGAGRDPHPRALKVLEAAGEPIAIIGCTIRDGVLTVEFGTFDETHGEIGPGDMLFFLAIREAAEAGLDIFDFGIGDEFYKRGWCEIETRHADTIIPLDAYGRLLGAARIAQAGVIRSIKANPAIWKAVKELRRRLPIAR